MNDGLVIVLWMTDHYWFLECCKWITGPSVYKGRRRQITWRLVPGSCNRVAALLELCHQLCFLFYQYSEQSLANCLRTVHISNPVSAHYIVSAQQQFSFSSPFICPHGRIIKPHILDTRMPNGNYANSNIQPICCLMTIYIVMISRWQSHYNTPAWPEGYCVPVQPQVRLACILGNNHNLLYIHAQYSGIG